MYKVARSTKKADFCLGVVWSKIDSDSKERFEKNARAAKEKYEEEYQVARLVLILMVDCELFCFQEWFKDGGGDALKAQ